MTRLPRTVTIDAWAGAPSSAAELAKDARKWGARRAGLPESQAGLPFGPPVDPRDWAHPDIGYGVLLRDPEDPALTPVDLAAGVDAEEPVRRILAERPGTVVLRWRPALGTTHVGRHFADGGSQDPRVGLTPFGTGKGRLPRYVLIVGGPEVIPWEVQYALSVRHAVGRLPLTGEALANYVSAMLTDWPGCALDRQAPVLWTVDHGGGDITSLMRAALMSPLAAAMTGTLPGLRRLGGPGGTGPASGANLCAAVQEARPALLVTSSHGSTAPLGDGPALAAGLGLPVDEAFVPVPEADLLTALPCGAVWFAQACCSAGADGTSQFAGLVVADSDVDRILTAVAGVGPRVAPLPLALLGRPAPVRAVLGHVEPTFDWTLRDPETGQKLGGHLVGGLTSNLFHDWPLGLALEEYRDGVGVLHTEWARARARLDSGDFAAREDLTYLRLTALDRQALVLLGDPTVRLG